MITNNVDQITRNGEMNRLENLDTYDNLTDEEVRLLIERKVQRALNEYKLDVQAATMSLAMIAEELEIKHRRDEAQNKLDELLKADLNFEEV